MKKSPLTALACILFATPALAQKVSYEKYQLPNGMTVILHEDHSLPVATINTWYYVGSKDEAPGRSGFAHLFEHLMFMGTRRVPGADFDKLMEGGGGWNNASTSEDRTNYYSFGPSSLLPVLLWLDADRLEDLGKEMTLDKLNKQREVVRNERRQTSEMQPYGVADLKIGELMYPAEHPYHHTVIGSHEDLEAATLQDVKDFFARYYVPNNASLVVAGDFDPAQIKPLIAKLFGTLPRGPEPLHKRADPVRISEVRRVTYTDDVQFPRYSLYYHSPAHFADGDAQMDLAAAILGDGKSSRLYKRLVYDDKLATSVSAQQASTLLGSLFYVEITARPDASREQIEKATDEVLAEFIANGPTADELDRQKARIEYATISGLQDLLNKADQLNEYQFAFGEPDSFARDLQRYRDASPQDVKNWSESVLTPEARLIMWVLPENKSQDILSAREEKPALSADKSFQPQMPETLKLSNGLEVRLWRRPELPLAYFSLMLRGGAANDEPQKMGRTLLTTSMLDEGAGSRGAIEFQEALDQLGARLTPEADQESVTVGLSVLKRNLIPALDLFADAILRPRFDEKEWQRVQRLHVEGLKRAEDQPTVVAGRVGLRAYFGDAHPYGRPATGTVDSVEKLGLDDLKACHAETFVPSKAILFVAGDLTIQEAKDTLEKAIGSWRDPANVTKQASPAMPSPVTQSLRVVVVDKPDAVQTVIRFFMPGAVYASPDRLKLEMLNTILGGSFTSRLNANLREEHGYTYGARSSYTMAPRVGYFSAGSDVQAEHTGDALREFLKEFEKIRSGDITSAEAEKARQTNRMELIQSFQGLSGLIEVAQVFEENNRPFSALGEDLAGIGALTEKDANTLAKAAIPLENGLLVLVGNKKLILEQLKGLPLPAPVELTVTGDPKSDSAS